MSTFCRPPDCGGEDNKPGAGFVTDIGDIEAHFTVKMGRRADDAVDVLQLFHEHH